MGQADPKLLAEGDLSVTPALHILLHLEQRALSGTLLLLDVERAQSDRVLFLSGRPTAGMFVRGASSLSAGLLGICARTRGSYAFLEADLLSGQNTTVRGAIDTFALVARACREMPRADLIDMLLARYGEHAMRLQPGQPLHRLQLTADENLLVDLLRAAPAAVPDLERWSPLPVAATRALLYLLVVTRMVAPYAGHGQPARSGSQMTVMPAPPTSVVTSRLSVGSKGPLAPLSQVGSTSVPSPEAQGSRASARAKASEEEEGALAELHRAEARIQSGRAGAALAIVDRLLQQEPRNPRYLGLRAYALMSEARGSGHQGVPSAVVVAIKEALAADEGDSRALYAQALAFLQLGKLKRALLFTRRAREADPEFLPATRELRLLEQRLQRPGRTRG